MMLLKNALDLVLLCDIAVQYQLRITVVQTPWYKRFGRDRKYIIPVLSDSTKEICTYKTTSPEYQYRAGKLVDLFLDFV